MTQPSGSSHLQVPHFEQTNLSQQTFVTAPETSEYNQNVSTPQNSSLDPNSPLRNPTTSNETIPLHLTPPTRFSFPQQSSRFSEDFSSSESTHHNSNQHSRSTFQTLTNTHSRPNNQGYNESQEEKSDTATRTTTSPQHIHFRSMTWLHCAFIMIAETISLGILALPSVLSTIGLVPGLILIISMGILAWYSGLLIHRFRTAYPSILSWADASFASIGTAVIITMISVGVRAPTEKTYSLWPKKDLSVREAFLSVTNIVFAYAGHIAFFTFISELRTPSDFPKSLATLQTIEIALYLLSSILIYIYTGSSISSPALLSAGPLLSKIAFGIAIPTIVIAGVIFCHVGSKYIFLRIFTGTPHAETRTKRGLVAWLGITGGLWVLAWIIGESVPGFNELLGLVSSLFASWFTYGLPGVMGLWLQLGNGRGGGRWGRWGGMLVNGLLVGVGAVLCRMGVWASGVGIRETSQKGGSWSCG
ncbi:putative amino acid protein [Botrytis fragariae]|uniref:Putative amino acid protein n=1 Tax=Botrytis fragariae TaxID=1964551 RepID=A0A8H6EGD8_9HELO|nr:putative amino acid protein [Botrytis fragariae]KAF5871349.1 putative amino acid protein [Botrytis fragariae]